MLALVRSEFDKPYTVQKYTQSIEYILYPITVLIYTKIKPFCKSQFKNVENLGGVLHISALR